jgi:hypothetical protein
MARRHLSQLARLFVRTLCVVVAACTMGAVVEMFMMIWGGNGPLLICAFAIPMGFAALILYTAFCAWDLKSVRSVRWLCCIAAIGSFWFSDLPMNVIDGVYALFARIPGFTALTQDDQTATGYVLGAIIDVCPLAAVVMLYFMAMRRLLAILKLREDRSVEEQLSIIRVLLLGAAFAVFSHLFPPPQPPKHHYPPISLLADRYPYPMIPDPWGLFTQSLETWLAAVAALSAPVILYKIIMALAARRFRRLNEASGAAISPALTSTPEQA